MKKIGSIQLGLTFAGCFLGAGYVSGQEMWQFFGRFGRNGIIGLFFALFLLGFVGIAMLRLTEVTGILDTDRLIAEGEHPLLHSIITVFEIIFLFGVSIIMTAGVGALAEKLFGIPLWLGCAVFSAVVTAAALTGLRGMVAAFSATVPILVLATLLFGIYSLLHSCISFAPMESSEAANPLLLFWPLAAISFACYNMFCSVAIIAPLGVSLKSGRTAFGGIALGVLILLFVALSVLISVSAVGTGTEELPMLSMALAINRPLGLIYGILLFLAMFGACLSNLIAFVRVVASKSKKIASSKIAFHIFCGIAVFALSLFGFGDLIGVLYPIFGYCSSIFIVMLVIRYLKMLRKPHI